MTTYLEGIDVSVYQAETPRLVGLDFLIARASIGTRRDTRYAQHVRNARAAGLVAGAYHFADSRIPVADQVVAFLGAIAAGGPISLRAVDVEGDHELSSAELEEFLARMRAAGAPCGLYHSLSGYPTRSVGQAFDWVAKWSATPPARHWDIWQYQGSPLDRDRFAGSRAELIALGGGSGMGDWRILTAVPGTYTVTTTKGAGWINPDTGAVGGSLSPGEHIYVMAQVEIGWQWDQAGYLCSDKTVHGRLVLAGDGSFAPTPAPAPPVDCGDVQRELDELKAAAAVIVAAGS